MGTLSRSWEAVGASWPSSPQVNRVKNEVLALISLAPLLQTDLQTDYDSSVACSDASEVGGPITIPVLVISVFNGIGGAFRLYDVLGLSPQEKNFY